MMELTGGYWEDLKKFGLPNLMYLGSDLVVIIGKEYLKRKNGAKINQCYYYIDDGRCKHASFFKKVDIKMMSREYKLNNLLN